MDARIDAAAAPKGPDLGALLDILRRRWPVVLIPVALLAPLALLVAYILPPSYTATARVLVESQQIPQDLAQTTVTVGVAERIALIQQRLITRSSLLDLAERFPVANGLPSMSPSDLVKHMREATSITGVRLADNRSPITAIDISYTSNNAALSSQVANELLTRLLTANVQQRTSQAQETSAYFRREVERLGEELNTAKDRFARFKIENEDALPDGQNFRRSELSALEGRTFERELRILELENEKKSLMAALDENLPLVSADGPSPLEGELQNLRSALTQQSAVLAESHPNMRALRARIAALEAALREAASGGAAESSDDAEESPQAALARRRIKEALERIDQTLGRMTEQHSLDLGRIEALRESVEREPEVELSLNEMQLDLAALQTQYSAAVEKLSQAQTGERLEVNRQAERFEVIERAEPPARPTAPNRPVIAAAGIFASFAVGVALAGFLELMNRSVRRSGDLERLLGLRPVVSIPYIVTASEVRRRNWMWRLLALFVLVVAPAGLFLIDQYVAPLSQLAERFGTAIGLDRLEALFRLRFGG